MQQLAIVVELFLLPESFRRGCLPMEENQ